MKIPECKNARRWQVDAYRSYHKKLNGRLPTQLQVKRYLRSLAKFDFDYLEYQERNDEVVKFICGKCRKIDSGVTTFFAHPCFFGPKESTRGKVIATLKTVVAELDECKMMSLALEDYQTGLAKLLVKIGFTYDATDLAGDVLKARNISLSRLNDEAKGLSFKRFNMRRDWQHLHIAKFRDARKGVGDARVDYKRRSEQEWSRKSWSKLSRDRDWAECLVAYDNDCFVGAISSITHQMKNQRGNMHIFDVTIDPGYQGRGLAYALYYRILDLAHQRKTKAFTGCTTTKRVLAMAKRLGRQPLRHNYFINVNKL